MQMHPCLRQLAHIAESGDWNSPSELTFHRGSGLVFLEPSAKSAQRSELMVDYEANEPPNASLSATEMMRAIGTPALDFVGATENRVGRAILVQASSNLDGYLYRLDGAAESELSSEIATAPKQLPSLEDLEAQVNPRYIAGLSEGTRDAAIALAWIGTDQRRRWRVDRWGMIAADYTLLILYALDQDIRERWPRARDVYVYGAERFVNAFLPSLATGADVPLLASESFPDIFRPSSRNARISQKKVFTQIQRLAAFGLVITRANVTYRSDGTRISGATRSRVYTTREEIQINSYGRDYVEQELRGLNESYVDALRSLVASRQQPHRAALTEMARIYAEIEYPAQGRADSPKDTQELEEQRSYVASTIHEAGGCAMTFTDPSALTAPNALGDE